MSPIWCFSVFFRVTILLLCIQLFQDPFRDHLEISTGFLLPKAHILKKCASFCHNNSGSKVVPNTLIFLFFVSSLFFFFNLWWILSYIEMKQPRVYMCSPSQSPLPPPSPHIPSRFSQCTRSEHLSHASNLGW